MALRRNRHLRTALDIEIANKQAFRQAAVDQRFCAVCEHPGKPHTYDAHHVVPKSKLKKEGFEESDRYDTRNCLRVCNEYGGNCHQGHTDAMRKIPLSALTDDNIAYAFEILGARAYYLLHRQYAGDDERVETALKEVASAPL